MPGTTAFPPTSIRRVFGPARRLIWSLVPTATIRSPRTAMACRMEKRSSTVMILPLVITISAAGACARTAATAGNRPTTVTASFRNVRVCFTGTSVGLFRGQNRIEEFGCAGRFEMRVTQPAVVIEFDGAIAVAVLDDEFDRIAGCPAVLHQCFQPVAVIGDAIHGDELCA